MTTTTAALAELVHNARTETLDLGRDWRPRLLALIITNDQWAELCRDRAITAITAAQAVAHPDTLVELYIFDVPVWIADSDKVPGPALVERGRIPVTARPAKV